MTAKKTFRIRKIMKLSLLLLLGAGILILSVSAVRKDKKDESITGVHVRFPGNQEHPVLSEEEVLSILKRASKNNITHQPADSLDLTLLEQELNKNPWINKAQVYVDNRGVLRVDVQENKPVARVFVPDGESFYLADNLQVMPVRKSIPNRVPLFTGFRGNMAKPGAKDSLLFRNINKISGYLLKQPFWLSQIDQIDVVDAGQFDLIPRLGNQIIHLGNADDCEAKFDKLLAFYKQVMMNTGWNKYAAIDLRFENQVVAERRDAQKITADSLAVIRVMQQVVSEAKKKERNNNTIQLPEREDKQNGE